METIASALGSIPAVVWGEMAIAALGVGLVCEHYMLVIDDADLNDAAQQLRSQGFQDWAWSYGSLRPSFYEGKGRLMENIYRDLVNGYSNLDRHSVRFVFPPDRNPACSAFPERPVKVVLLPSSYTHICVRSILDDAVAREGNVIYPGGALLLQSFVQTLVREPADGMWTSNLGMWAISYVYGELDLKLNEDVLDACDDEDAKAWFNKAIDRYGKGLDRVTCTKRLGRVGYDESLARRRDPT